MFLRVFGRYIEFLGIFCIFSKIPLVTGEGRRQVVVGGDRGNLIFSHRKIFPAYGNVTIPYEKMGLF